MMTNIWEYYSTTCWNLASHQHRMVIFVRHHLSWYPTHDGKPKKKPCLLENDLSWYFGVIAFFLLADNCTISQQTNASLSWLHVPNKFKMSLLKVVSGIMHIYNMPSSIPLHHHTHTHTHKNAKKDRGRRWKLVKDKRRNISGAEGKLQQCYVLAKEEKKNCKANVIPQLCCICSLQNSQ